MNEKNDTYVTIETLKNMFETITPLAVVPGANCGVKSLPSGVR